MKRFFDFVVSLLMLIILSPLFLIVSLIILIDAGRPVIFKQYRVGKGNKLFYIYKFRTMKQHTRTASTKDLGESDDCITRSGRILRKLSIDELPQLLNVLKGSMSFVGPRPLIPEEKEIRELRKRYGVYSVRPGITGLAQVNGRDTLPDDIKANYDKTYVENHSVKMDIQILLKTILVVIKRENITEGAENVSRPVGSDHNKEEKKH